jgi:hypothetical protein
MFATVWTDDISRWIYYNLGILRDEPLVREVRIQCPAATEDPPVVT